LELRAESAGTADLKKYCVEKVTITGSGVGNIKI
jgi:hypothetical protein